MSNSEDIMDKQHAWIAEILGTQKESFLSSGIPDLAIRIDRLNRLECLLLENHDEIVATESEDFGGRAATLTRAADILGGVGVIHYNRDNLEEWMKAQPVVLPDDAQVAGMRAEIQYQPLGVVGVIIPWNGPFLLSTIAVANIFAAGNRVMLKPSELAPKSSALLARLFSEYFDPAEVAVIEGDAEVSKAFSRQPFDHMLFTGSTRVGREIMKVAAENLVPVTLELGGKCPVIIGSDVDQDVMAARLSYSKLIFGGQVCVTPDYVLAPKGRGRQIADAILQAARNQYPEVSGNEDYTAIINDNHFARLSALIDDARHKGAQILTASTSSPDSSNDRRMPLTIVLNATDDMEVMKEEIFGPVLPILEYNDIGEAISCVNQRSKPLSAYYFGHDIVEQTLVQNNIWTGSVVINDALCQIFHEALPFGGVGPSGMGRYRGYEGFKTFSNQLSVVHQGLSDEALAAQRPPYSAPMTSYISDAIDALKASCKPSSNRPQNRK